MYIFEIIRRRLTTAFLFLLGVGLRKLVFGGTLPTIWTGEVAGRNHLLVVWDTNNPTDYWIGFVHSTNNSVQWQPEIASFAAKSISVTAQLYSNVKVQTTSANPDFHYQGYVLTT